MEEVEVDTAKEMDQRLLWPLAKGEKVRLLQAPTGIEVILSNHI